MTAGYSNSEIFMWESTHPDGFEGYGSVSEISEFQPIATRDSVTVQSVRPVPTPEQIRYWKQREVNKMFHGGQKEMQSLLVATVETNQKIASDLILPERPFSEKRQDWLTLIIFLTFILFVSVRHAFGKYLSTLFQSLFNYSTASRMYRERNISLGYAELRLELFTYLVLGVFFFQMADMYNLNLPFNGFLNYLSGMLIVAIFIFLKKLIYRLLGYLVDKASDMGEYLYNFNNYIKAMGTLSLPVVIIIAWAPLSDPRSMIVPGLTIISILYLFLLWRGIKIFLKKQFSIFYLFLYLCTLEILPLLLLVKAVTE